MSFTIWRRFISFYINRLKFNKSIIVSSFKTFKNYVKSNVKFINLNLSKIIWKNWNGIEHNFSTNSHNSTEERAKSLVLTNVPFFSVNITFWQLVCDFVHRILYEEIYFIHTICIWYKWSKKIFTLKTILCMIGFFTPILSVHMGRYPPRMTSNLYWIRDMNWLSTRQRLAHHR